MHRASVHWSQVPTAADVPSPILDTVLEVAMAPLSVPRVFSIFNIAWLINSLLLITSRSDHDYLLPFFSLSLFLYKLPLAPQPFIMHYKCLSLSKNVTRSTFSLTLCLCLSLVIFSLVPRTQSMYSAS